MLRSAWITPVKWGLIASFISAAAYHLYGGPIIVVDMGTATTFDTMTKNGEYTGGAIAPGIQTGAEALFSRTAMLPRLNLMRPV